MLQAIAADISPTDRLADHVPAVVDGGGDAHLVPAQASFAVLRPPLMRIVAEPVLPVVRDHIRVIHFNAEINSTLPVSLEARGKIDLILLDHALEDPSPPPSWRPG